LWLGLLLFVSLENERVDAQSVDDGGGKNNDEMDGIHCPANVQHQKDRSKFGEAPTNQAPLACFCRPIFRMDATRIGVTTSGPPQDTRCRKLLRVNPSLVASV